MNLSFHKQHTIPNLTFDENSIEPIPKEIGPYTIKSLFNKNGDLASFVIRENGNVIK